MNFTQQVWKGFWAPLGALRFLKAHRRLKRYLALPVLLNMLVFAGLYYAAWVFADRYLDRILVPGDTWYWMALYYLLTAVTVLALLVVTGLVTALVAGVVAAPFNDLIAERTIEIVDGKDHAARWSLRMLGRESRWIIMQQIRKLVFLLVCAGVLFVLQFAPGFGLVVQFVLYPVFVAFAACLEFMDYGMERRRLPFKQKRRFLMRRPGLIIGFGGGSTLILMVPILNFLAMPVLVVAGSLLYLAAERQ